MRPNSCVALCGWDFSENLTLPPVLWLPMARGCSASPMVWALTCTVEIGFAQVDALLAFEARVYMA